MVKKVIFKKERNKGNDEGTGDKRSKQKWNKKNGKGKRESINVGV